MQTDFDLLQLHWLLAASDFYTEIQKWEIENRKMQFRSDHGRAVAIVLGWLELGGSASSSNPDSGYGGPVPFNDETQTYYCNAGMCFAAVLTMISDGQNSFQKYFENRK